MDTKVIMYIVVGGMAFVAGILALLNLYVWYKEKHKRQDELVESTEQAGNEQNCKMHHMPSFDDKRLDECIVERLRKNLSLDTENGSVKSTHMLYKPRPPLADIVPEKNGYTVTM